MATTQQQDRAAYMQERQEAIRSARQATGLTMAELMRLSNKELQEVARGGQPAAGTPPVGSPNPNLSDLTPDYDPAPVVAPPPPPPPKPIGQGIDPTDPAAALGPLIAKVVQPYLDAKTDAAQVTAIAQAVATKVVEANTGKLDEDRVKQLIEDARIPRDIVVTLNAPGKDPVVIKGGHEQIAKLAYYVAKRRHCYMWGPPGGGKTSAAKTIADAEGLKFGAIQLNPQTPKSELFGFFAPDNKTYRKTLFRQIWEEGGIFLIDEIDNADDSLLTTLNTALANNVCTFPDAMVERHPDFVCLATGNSAGRGGDVLHQSRRPLSGATLDRFISLHWGYDEALEERVAISHNPQSGKLWFGWVRAARRAAMERKLPVTISPRATFVGAEALLDYPGTLEELADELIFNKGVPPQVKEQILLACPLPKLKGATGGPS